MTRRVGAQRGRVVPGLSDAVADYCQRFADRWPTRAAIATADAAEHGKTIEIDGTTVWLALFRAGSPLAGRFEHDEHRYTLTAPDELATADRT